MTEYETWSKAELIERIRQLEKDAASAASEPSSLPSLISSSSESSVTVLPTTSNASETSTQSTSTPTASTTKPPKGPKAPRPFNFSAHSCRPIALKVAYLGHGYHGLATQGVSNPNNQSTDPPNVQTVEGVLISALVKARLIPSWRECGWSRCGRTDKGVSGFDQVIGLYVRSSKGLGANGTFAWGDVKVGEGTRGLDVEMEDREPVGHPPADADDDENELPYLTILNGLLPPTIRVLAWSPVAVTFNARFDCIFRRYQYIMPSLGLDVSKMQEAAKLLEGEHDFRFLCRIDSSNPPRTFVRSILSASVRYLDREDNNFTPKPQDFIVFEVKGTAFLYNQVRCMMAMLQLIGRGLEPPSLISNLLNLSEHPDGAGRPIYPIASEYPLILMECGYPSHTFRWRYNPAVSLAKLGESLFAQWLDHAVKARQIEVLMALAARQVGSNNQEATISDLFGVCDMEVWRGLSGEVGKGDGKNKYVDVLKRKRCEGIDVRMERFLEKENEKRESKAGSANGNGKEVLMEEGLRRRTVKDGKKRKVTIE
ncbi:tRNA pseudouridine synthase 3 [Phlyctochytrium planicorne]|nr:tRNA pseudouridine synthase 3 [Phlyctochytrium planicorne]